MGEFYQTGPQLSDNLYSSDGLLRAYMQYRLPAQIHSSVSADLERFGARVAGDVLELAQEADREKPEHIPFDSWGRRIDEIRVSPGWEALHGVAAEEGLIALAYERGHGAFSRLHQFAKLYLYHPSSAFYSCPLAMTDGAARALELHGTDELKKTAFKNLTSRDPKKFWTSGQWMTERAGGSDVGQGTATQAKKIGGEWQLFGDKWFTSATTSQMTLTLGRPEGEPEGSKGLAMFFVQVHDSQGRLQNIEINRLKNKLGTDALPTAELRLNGTPAVMLGATGEGVRKISTLLNITRLHNSICATAQIRRALSLALDYAHKRKAFGKKLIDHPLHLETLSEIQVDFEACFHLVMHLAWLLGKEETGEATPQETAILRVLTPVAKLWTAKRSLASVSECLEAFGGAGYIEDTGLPRLLRDAQVFSIWEGTTNVLALDVLRAVGKGDVLGPLFSDVQTRLEEAKKQTSLGDAVGAVAFKTKKLSQAFSELAKDPSQIETSARELAFGLAEVFTGALLLEFAAKHASYAPGQPVAQRFAARQWQWSDKNSEHRKATSVILGL